MVYKYSFLNNNYVNIEDFAVGLSNNYGDAINFIFTDSFINQIDDYYLRGRIQTEMRRCKYVESVFTMVIYLLNPSLGLCVRGRFFKTLEELANYMHITSANKDLSVIHLFLDNCITHTLGAEPNFNEEFKDNIVYIEDNINDNAIYEYFIDLFNIKFKREDAHGLTIFDYYLSTISTSVSRLDSYLSLINDPGFKSALYKTFGLKRVLEIYNEKNAPFTIIKLIDDYTKLDIVQFLDMGITNWLLNNYKNYKFSMDTLKLKNLLKECAKESKRVMNVDERVKFNEKVYTYYRNFLNLYDCHKIVEASEEYRLDIYYNRNRGCIKYYQDIGLNIDHNKYKINLQTYSKENIKKIMKHSFGEINEYNEIDNNMKTEIKQLPINYRVKLTKNLSNAWLLLLVSLVAGSMIGYLAFTKVSLFGSVEYLTVMGTSLALFLFTFINITRISRCRRILNREFLIRDKEYYVQAKENKTLGYRKAYASHLLLNTITTALFAATLAFISYASIYLVKAQALQTFIYSFAGIGAFGLIFALFTRKKVNLNLLLLILIPLTMILLFIL